MFTYPTTLLTGRSFNFGKALLHDGINDKVSHTNIPVAISTPFTYSVWLNTEDLTGRVFASGGTGEHGLSFNTATSLRAFLNNSVYDFTVPTMSLNTWYMVTCVRENDDSLHYYLNDTESTTTTHVATESMEFDTIGCFTFNPLVGWKGKLNKPSFHFGAITPTQVSDLWNNGDGANFDDVVPNPTAHWRFNESGTDTIAVEINGNYNGTLTGFPTNPWVDH